MESRSTLSKGSEIAQFYYSAQRYFHQLILLTEGVANLLTDKGWKITWWNYGRPVGVACWSWTNDRSLLPKSYVTRFERKEGSKDLDKYGFSVWFFCSDPTGEQEWVPTAYFFRVSLKTEGKLEDWKVDPKIAQVIRPMLLAPTLEGVFIELSEPWPNLLAGDGVDTQIESINVVPFPLASIETSEHLETITIKAVKALALKNPSILREDKEYLKLAWSL